MRPTLTLPVVALLFSTAAEADPRPPTAFTCVFKQGAVWSFEKGTFRPQEVSRLQVEIVRIDREKQTAEIKSEGGTSPLRIVLSLNGVHFIEAGVDGFLNVTTVYQREGATGMWPAAHSRHFGVLGQPLVSQYLGQCHSRYD